MGVLAWVVLGLVAGVIAKAIMPGKDPGGVLITILIGIVGAFIGGFVGSMVARTGITGLNPWSIGLAILGAVILLAIFRAATGPRSATSGRRA
jgi:uncharacterized membrane protein YeaQ/YmgE (transglycosylase-associated protein family)